MAYYSLDINLIKPSAIEPKAGVSRGWIDDNGMIYAGEGEHDSILTRILKTSLTDRHPGRGSGWIRWLASITNTLYVDWSEYGNSKSEDLARSIVKQVHYPFTKVWIDAPGMVSWKGPIDDFVKFGIKGRRPTFESRLEALLRTI